MELLQIVSDKYMYKYLAYTYITYLYEYIYTYTFITKFCLFLFRPHLIFSGPTSSSILRDYFFLFYFLATPAGAQGSILTLYSEVIPGRLWGPYAMPGIEPHMQDPDYHTITLSQKTKCCVGGQFQFALRGKCLTHCNRFSYFAIAT